MNEKKEKETKSLPFVLPYTSALMGSIREGLDEFQYRNDKDTKISTSDNLISIRWGQYVFMVDVIDGVDVGNNECSEFAYFNHAEIPVAADLSDPNYEGDDTVIKKEPMPVGADWYNIRVIDAIIERAKSFAYIDMVTDHIEMQRDAESKASGLKVKMHVNRVALENSKRYFSKAFVSLLGADEELLKNNVVINSYVDYTNQHQIILHVRLKPFETKGYIDTDNAEFFLTYNVLTTKMQIMADLPWVTEYKSDLFTLAPKSERDDRSLLSVIRIASDYMLYRMSDNVDNYFSAAANLDLLTDATRVNKFIGLLEVELSRLARGSVNKLTKENHITTCYPNGLSRIQLGTIVVDVAIDGFGLVDVTVDHEISHSETWDEIIWNHKPQPLSIGITDRLSDMNGLMFGQNINDYTSATLSVICEAVKTAMNKLGGK